MRGGLLLLACPLMSCAVRLAAGPTMDGAGRVGAQAMLTYGTSRETHSSRVFTAAPQGGGGISPAHTGVASTALVLDYAPNPEALWRAGIRTGVHGLGSGDDVFAGLAGALLPWRWSHDNRYRREKETGIFPDAYSAVGVEMQTSVIFAGEPAWLGWASLTYDFTMPWRTRPDFDSPEITRPAGPASTNMGRSSDRCSVECPCTGTTVCVPPTHDLPCGPAGCREMNLRCGADTDCDPGWACGASDREGGPPMCRHRGCTISADCGAHDLICDDALKICLPSPCTTSSDCHGVCIPPLAGGSGSCWPTPGMCLPASRLLPM